MSMSHQFWSASIVITLLVATVASADDAKPNGRRPKTEDDLRYWLLNMERHGYSLAEKAEALAMPEGDVKTASARLIKPGESLRGKPGELQVLPYPGGRHPRIGFLDGAVNPQRETKASVFLPWDDAGYVVVDLPEAIWSNLGLTYLAHTHVPTIWSKQGIELEQQEWKLNDDGSLELERKLPNGIAYAAKIESRDKAVHMQLSLTNGVKEKLSDLRIQNCVMLKGAADFAEQANDNKLFRSPFVAVHDKGKRRWIITAWERCHRPWGNAPCPCLHSDPKFPDLAPGETGHLAGWLWCYAGDDIDSELKRLTKEMER
jgi:hypothetical protein